MTIKEAILKSLEDFPHGATAKEAFNNIIDRTIFTFSKNAKTPDATVHACMGEMIKNGDTRIKRFKNDKNVYCYYLDKFSDNFKERNKTPQKTQPKPEAFHERVLHPLLCTYLHHQGVMAKTIYHEKSTKGEEHQKWIHPDIIGAQFIENKNKTSNALFKAMSKQDSVHLFSYELKKRIDNDYELKKCFFQAVSNSSWANYGYLVAFDINEELKDEIARLNQSFGIGFILLKANPYESQVWFQAQGKPLDFSTIDKLCGINQDFEQFIKYVEATLTADDKHFGPSKDALVRICDKVLDSDEEIKVHCNKYGIPYANEEEIEEA